MILQHTSTQELVDKIGVMVIGLDVDNRIILANAKGCAFLGYDRDKLLGMDWSEHFLRPQDRRPMEDFFARTMAGGNPPDAEHDSLVLLRSGGQRLVRWHTSLLTGESGAVIGLLCTGEDITNFVAVKRDVTREKILEKQLQQAMKMEAIGTLAGGIAHDFNNILSMMLGYAEIVESQLDDNDTLKGDIGQIIAAGNRAADLVQRILTFSRNEIETLRPLKLQGVINETLQMLRPTLPATIKLERAIDDDCGSVMGEVTQIQQILINLVTNARQAMGQNGGTLRISLEQFQIPAESPVNFHTNITEGKWLDLEVSDTGPGIPSEIMEQVFDPFFTTKEKGTGTGLGLSVVHGIVKSLDGEITVSSLVGSGTTFHIYLPVIVTEQKRSEKEGKNTTLPRGNECILVLDDEPTLVNIMERILVRLGYTVLPFTNSEKALEQFRQHTAAVDLIITDMTMPVYTGADLAKKILATIPGMPIILCSGYNEYINDTESQKIGISEFVEKPVNAETLAKVVRKVLDDR